MEFELREIRPNVFVAYNIKQKRVKATVNANIDPNDYSGTKTGIEWLKKQKAINNGK